jgi:thiazole synthase ThiGH ThiG subunit
MDWWQRFFSNINVGDFVVVVSAIAAVIGFLIRSNKRAKAAKERHKQLLDTIEHKVNTLDMNLNNCRAEREAITTDQLNKILHSLKIARQIVVRDRAASNIAIEKVAEKTERKFEQVDETIKDVHKRIDKGFSDINTGLINVVVAIKNGNGKV